MPRARLRRPSLPGSLLDAGRHAPEGRADRFALQCRFRRALRRALLRAARLRVPGWNTRYRGAEDLFHLEHALSDIGVGVRWLREQGVETVVLLGNSGGGSLMAAYQAEAEAKGDLYISLNAHPGRPEVLTNWMDASVTDERDPVATDPELDPFAQNLPFTEEFVVRYRAAQSARNQRVTDWAKAELARLRAAGIPDRIFPVFRTWADLRFIDPAQEPTERPCPAAMPGRRISPIAVPSASAARAPCAPGCRCGAWRRPGARARRSLRR